MTFERQFVTGVHLLAFIGVAALAATHEVGAPFLLGGLAGLVWSAWGERRSSTRWLSPSLANVAIVFAMVVILSPVFSRGASPVRAIGEFLLVLVGLKGAALKEIRDWLQIAILSFFQLLAASALTVEPIFGLVFLAYLMVAPCVLVLLLLRREVEAAGGARRLTEEPFIEPSLFRSLAATTAVLFVSTLVLFVLFPRMGAGYFGSPFSANAAHAGFSESVGPGEVAALAGDDSVALRVVVDQPERLPTPVYWRGIALDQFDGRVWRRRAQDMRRFFRTGPGSFMLPEPPNASALVREEIILEPQDTSALFVAGRALEIRGQFYEAAVDGLGSLRAIRPTGIRTRYDVLATLTPRRDRPSPATLQLPGIDPRIVDLVQTLIAGKVGARARLNAIQAHFQRGFRYTLDPGDPGEEDPLVRFLFQTKQGHCEYFSSALAVMLRLAGVPAVVVGGYLGGEWNEYGGYYLVRQRNAHSWVEAYVDGVWLPIDPTPPTFDGGADFRRRISDFADALQMRWYRYVVNYSVEDQAAGALSLRDATRHFWEQFRFGWRDGDDRAAEETGSPSGRASRFSWTWIVTLVVAALAGLAFRSRRPAGPGAEQSEAARRYQRLLGALAPLGIVKRAGETPSEFSRRSAHALPAEADRIERITELYEESRFSGRPTPSEPLDRELDALVAALAETAAPAGARTAT